MSIIFNWRWVLLVVLSVVSGCIMLRDEVRVDVETRNYTDQLLSEVVVWFGENACGSGYIVGGGQKTFVLYPHPITKTARVCWRDAAGERHEVEVDLSNIYKRGQSTRLEIGIKEDGVYPRLKPLAVRSGVK